ncbi:MAG: AMIN domain-containing protein, partial [Pacificimonas sp.]
MMMIRWGTALLAAMLVVSVGFVADAATLKTVTVAEAGAGLRLTLTFDGDFAAPESFALEDPKRLVIDLPDAQAGGRSYSGAGVVTAIRTAQFDNHTARVVLDLDGPAEVTGFSASSRMLTVDLKTGEAVNFKRVAAASRKRLAGSPGLAVTQETAKQMVPVETITVPGPAQASPKPAVTKVEPKPEPVGKPKPGVE